MRPPFRLGLLPAVLPDGQHAGPSRFGGSLLVRAMMLDWTRIRGRAAAAVLLAKLVILLSGCAAADPNERVTGDCKLLISHCSSKQSVVAPAPADRARLVSLTERDMPGLAPDRATRAAAAWLHASGYAPVTHVPQVGLIEATADSVVASEWMRGVRAVLGGGGPLTAGDDHAETRALVLVAGTRYGSHLHAELWRTVWNNRGDSKTTEVTDPKEYEALYAGIAGGGAGGASGAAPSQAELRADGGRRTGGCDALHGMRRCSSQQVSFDPSPAARQALEGLALGRVADDLATARARAADALVAMDFSAVEAEDQAGIVRAERNTTLATEHQRMVRGILPKVLAFGAHLPVTGPIIGRPDHATINAVVVLAPTSSGTNVYLSLRRTVWDSKGDSTTRTLTDPEVYDAFWARMGGHRSRG